MSVECCLPHSAELDLEDFRTYVIDAANPGCFKDAESAWAKAEADGGSKIALVIRGHCTLRDTLQMRCQDKEVIVYGQGHAVLQLRSFPWWLVSVIGDRATFTFRDLQLDGGVQFTGRGSRFAIDACDVGVPDTCTLYGVWTSSASDCARSTLTVSRCVVHGFGHGISFSSPGGALRIENSEIHGCQQGVRVGGYDAFSAEVVGCQIHDCPKGGINFYKPLTARVFGCAMWESKVNFYSASYPPQPVEPFVSMSGNVVAEKGAGRPAFLPPLPVGPQTVEAGRDRPSESEGEAGEERLEEVRRAREEAEAAREEADRGREAAERGRAEAERGRSEAEGRRAEAEVGRAAADRARAEAERARAAAERRAEAAEQRAVAAEHRAAAEKRRREEAQRRAEDAERWRADAIQGAEGARAELRAAAGRAEAAEAELGALRVRLESALKLDDAHLRSLAPADLDALRPRLLSAIERVVELRAAARARAFDCSVCLESRPREDRRALQPCGHVLCRECAETLVARGAPCPSRCSGGAPIGGLLRVFD